MHKDISESRIAATALKEFNKKLVKFQKVIDKLVDYKVKVGKGEQEYSRFLTERILSKELKPVLHIKVMDEEDQLECLKHLLNLMSKKWLNVDSATFKY